VLIASDAQQQVGQPEYGGQGISGVSGTLLGPNAKIIAASQPTPVGAPIRLTRKTSANRSTLRIIPISVGSRYTTTIARNANSQDARLFARACMTDHPYFRWVRYLKCSGESRSQALRATHRFATAPVDNR
jgi:hypothetical protein